MPNRKIDAHQIRQRDILVLPLKRNIPACRWPGQMGNQDKDRQHFSRTIRSADQGQERCCRGRRLVGSLKDIKFPDGALDNAFAG